MKILVIGKNGQVGFELARILDCTTVDYPEIDLASAASIRSVLETVRPELIINAAAYTAVDKAEGEPALAMAINGEAPAILAEEAKKRGAFLVHYSTEYVYDGKLSRPYKESDPTGPLSQYGLSKLKGDQAIAAIAPRHLILRTSWVYGSRGHNFLLTMLRLGAERDSLSIVNDQIGAPTWCRDLAAATAAILPQAMNEGIHGVYHVAGRGETSWYGFAEAIFRQAGLNPKLTPIATEQYPTPAARPKNSRMDQSKLARDFGYAMPEWKESLKNSLAPR